MDHRQAADLLSKMDSFLESFLVSPHVIAAVQVMLMAGCGVPKKQVVARKAKVLNFD